ncbi:hypothetical protein N7495_007549 [Penicillium taxi]|uniref:uncharacterized protein n=1 Tax=Penicillium taxi TaxID=168475 RepID=UPI002545BB62|nr:uncharacterized protein N7495_007549 [Penicillium taxi]KAJ5887508.1 hypothetical protein N7495_007549 [Penicillium taxi]
MDEFEKLRAVVGRLEQYSTSRYQVKFYLNVAVTATYTLPESFTLPTKDYIYRACETLIGQHPVLSAIPAAEETQQPYFVRLPQINLDQAVSFEPRKNIPTESADGEPSPDLDLEALLEVQHNTPFAELSPNWRLCILTNPVNDREFTAAFVFHHALGDGNSGKAFHRTFLQALHSAPTAVETKSQIQSPQEPLLPNIEALHPMPLSIFYLAKQLFKAKIWSPSETGLWAGSEVQTPVTTRLRLLPFSKDVVASLRGQCRKEGTTITAFLQTMIARSLFAHLPDVYSLLICSGALSCRRWLPDIITDDSIGVYVSDFEEKYRRTSVMSSNGLFPWDETRRSRQTIEAVLELKGRDAKPNLLKFVDNYQQELCMSKLGQKRDKTFEVSNIGAFQAESDPGRPSIGGMVFSQCASVIGNAIEISTISGPDGCLVLGISWQDSVVEESLMEVFIKSTKDEMRRLAGCS